ncbi:hypothetical protein ACIRQQ_13195 [Streptomyces fuscichromogenes]|uniref:hypothetical protein n=1 Tax=Streptomyces fuscichromogenes TaxID=1324013 RepID=UPI003823522C
MTITSPPVCRHCDETITDPADAVVIGHDPGNSGPGWTIYAHRDHVDLVDLIDPVVLSVMVRLWAARQPL